MAPLGDLVLNHQNQPPQSPFFLRLLHGMRNDVPVPCSRDKQTNAHVEARDNEGGLQRIFVQETGHFVLGFMSWNDEIQKTFLPPQSRVSKKDSVFLKKSNEKS